MKIKDLPETEKPYERLECLGAEILSDAELLAIIIQSGTKEKSAISIAQEILLLDKDNKGLSFLKSITKEELMSIKGLGRIKSLQLKAIAELNIRANCPRRNIRQVIKSPTDVALLIMPEMREESQELFKTIVLNTQNQVLKIVTSAIGTANGVIVEPRDILKEAIKYNAPRIVVAHNHPSGNLTPSEEDIKVTKRLIEARQNCWNRST